MTTDRPEDLRRRVDELEATVQGLTQEWVEANERIRQLEAALDELSEKELNATNGGLASKKSPASDDAEEEKEPDLDDIIVA